MVKKAFKLGNKETKPYRKVFKEIIKHMSILVLIILLAFIISMIFCTVKAR